MARNARCIQMYSSVTSDRRRLREGQDHVGGGGEGAQAAVAHLALSGSKGQSGWRGGRGGGCKEVCHDSDGATVETLRCAPSGTNIKETRSSVLGSVASVYQ